MTETASPTTTLTITASGDSTTAAGANTCGGCDQRWSGVSRCHCAGNLTAQIDFIAVGDPKKAKIMASKFKNLLPLGTDAHLLADLVHDPLAFVVRRPRFTGAADPMLTAQTPVTTGGFTRASWGVLSGEPVGMDDLLLDGPATNPLSKVVALRRGATVFYLRSSLPRTRGEQPATDPKDVITLRVSAGCHRTFTGEAAFSLHHVVGEGCQDPATLVRKDGAHVGDRLLFLNNGLWGGEEHPAEPGAGLRAMRERKATATSELVDA